MNDTWLLILVGIVLFYLFTQKKKPAAVEVAAPSEPGPPKTVFEQMERIRLGDFPIGGGFHEDF